MNLFDILLIATIAVFGVLSYKKGFVRACFNFLPMLLSLLATYICQPVLSKILRGTFIYTSIKTGLFKSLNIENIIEEKAFETQTQLINNMKLPEFLKSALIENNNPVVYKVLDVEAIGDYITGFIANICINILAMIIISVVVFAICKALLLMLDLFTKLPVISSVNGMCGFAVGVIQGVFVIWIIGIVLTFFTFNEHFIPVFELLESSKIAKFFYENNLLLFMIIKIFT